jgi:cell division septation protein DedD
VTPTPDEGFHEIQLNGKQVVFLFMAATVVSVVIFLCGVLVGRGVRADRTLLADAAPVSAVAETTPPPQPQPAPAPASTPAASDPRSAAPPPGVDELSYFNRLETKTPPREQLKPVADRPAVEKPAADTPVKPVTPVTPVKETVRPQKVAERAAPVKPAAARPVTDTTAAAKPVQEKPVEKLVPDQIISAPGPAALEPRDAFAVQIAALNVRGEAEAIAKRLNSKGYAAYVLVPSEGTPSVYRVRIGKFPTRREAETVAAKLKKEEQFNPWITR